MSAFPDYETHDALGLAALVRQGAVGAEELLEAAIERIETRDPTINALVHRQYEAARQALAAGLPDGPFTGVPFLLKDLYAFEAGQPCGNGSRLFADYRADFDSEMVRRYRRAGLVVVGRSNTPEFGVSVTTEPAVNGPTRNPWDRTRSAGGSSGGAAAAVAAGYVPAAHASDGGGSIRIPASACGLFGLKPTRARNPAGEGWAGLSVHHVVSRSVRDSAALLDATHGYVPGYAYCAPDPTGPFLAEVGADPGRLRIAFGLPGQTESQVDDQCRAALADAVKLAADLGHEVEAAVPAMDFDALSEAMGTIVSASLASDLANGHPLEERPVRQDEVEPINWLFAEQGRQVSAVAYLKAVNWLSELRQTLADFFQRYDILMTPTLAKPPIPLGRLDSQSRDLEGFIEAIGAYIPFTQMFNMSGQPAASLPLHWTPEGLPVGVQIAGRFGDEATLLRLASQFEAARPWFDRRPAL